MMIGENMEQVDSRENGFALEVKNFLIGRVYSNIFRYKKNSSKFVDETSFEEFFFYSLLLIASTYSHSFL